VEIVKKLDIYFFKKGRGCLIILGKSRICWTIKKLLENQKFFDKEEKL
jgi:hypothetical protein